MKLAYSEARQRFGELCLRVLDRDALHVDGNELVEERLRALALTIAAGTSQIQRNIIGERVLGFPKEAALMDLDLSDDQVALRDGIAAMLEGRFGMDRVRAGFDRAMFDELAEAGVFSLRADGFWWADCVVVFEQLGRFCVPGPLVRVAAVRRRPRSRASSNDAGARLGRAPRRARRCWSCSPGRTVARVDPRARRRRTRRRGRSIRSRRSPRVDGFPPATPIDADAAELRRSRAPRSPPRSSSASPTAAPSSRSRTPRSACSSTGRSARSRRSSTCSPTCSCAPRWRGPRCTRGRGARRRCRGARRPRPRHLRGAKVVAGEAAIANGKAATQVFGGMGFTWEVDVHLYLKRAWVLDTHFGSADRNAERRRRRRWASRT